jgi:PKD repeat protein
VNTNFWNRTYIFKYQWLLDESESVARVAYQDMAAGVKAYLEGPYVGATIPRASWAMLHRLKPDLEMNASDNHLTDEAILPNATFIYTVDSGRCPLTPEEEDPSDEWVAMKVGYEAGWIMSHLQTRAPGFRVLPSASDKQEINNYFDTGSEEMSVQFIFEPESEVTVNLTSSNPDLMTITPSTLTFTTNNYDVAQSYTVSIADGVDATEEEIYVIVTTVSDDEVYDELSDRWAYTAKAKATASLPVAVADSYRVGVNQVLTVAVEDGLLANDIASTLSPVTLVTLQTRASNGSLNLSSDGSFTYTPNIDFDGADSFT